MFQNYFKVAVRNLFRYKNYSMINIAGLAVGIACSIIILIYIKAELSYDAFHENADNSYRLISSFPGEKISAVTSAPVAAAVVQGVPEVQSVTRIFRHWDKPLISRNQTTFVEDQFLFADPTFFTVFSFPLLQGDPNTVLLGPFSIVISESISRKYFGDENPIGKTISYNSDQDFMITAVMKDVPTNSHIQPEFIAAIDDLPKILWPSVLEMWSFNNFYTYVILEDGASRVDVNSKLRGLVSRHSTGEAELALQPLKSIHLRSQISNEISPNGDIRYIYLLGGLAILILAMASMNYVILAIAQSGNRAREVGMRKVVGAQRWQIIQQFFGESFLITFIAFLMALVLIWLVLPQLGTLMGKELVMQISDWWAISGLLGIMLVTGFLAGSYPTLIISRLKPVEVLKGRIDTLKGGLLPIKGLVVFQSVISISLVIGTLVIFAQLDYLQTTDVGFNREQILVMTIQDKNVKSQYASLRNKLQNLPGVISIGQGNSLPGSQLPSGNLFWEGKLGDTPVLTYGTWVGSGYIPTLEINLLSGRNFSDAIATDRNSVILNSSAARAAGWASPEEAVGKLIRTSMDARVDLTVIGVVEDYHFQSLHSKIEPLVLYSKNDNPQFVAVRINTVQVTPIIGSMKRIWTDLSSSQPFIYSFLDETFAEHYRNAQLRGQLMRYMSLIAIFIGGLGLFSLSTFITKRRTKEIGIRKVLGATAREIMLSVTKDFVNLVGIGFIIAVPLSFLSAQIWLQNFAYRVDIEIGTFIVAGALVGLVSALAVVFQSIKASSIDPAESLRLE